MLLYDSFNRKFEYLRLSITDACNFKCQYCLPNGFKPTSHERFLSIDEIVRLVRGFSELGMWKIRLTGGEPTLRRDFEDIVAHIASIEGIKSIVFSTNGFRLARDAHAFYHAGLRGVNISMDSLENQDFYTITGQNKLSQIKDGIEKCLEAGFHSVKINVVLLNGFNAHKLDSFLEFIQYRTVSIRFIELMQTTQNTSYFKQYHISANVVKERLLEFGFKKKCREPGAGPAEVWEHKDFQGSIGLIAPYSKDFCTTCNRLRVNSRGLLRLCLFGEGGVNLRNYLQDDNETETLKEVIRNALKIKKETHSLNLGDAGDTPHLASIGG